MTDYSNYISRSDASSYLLPDQQSKEIIEALPTSSFCLRMMKSLPPINAATYKIPMMNAFPTAYFVSEVAAARGATNTKKTTDMSWSGVTMYIEEIAVIVPVPESVIADMAAQNFDLWGMVKPRLVEAAGKLIDQAILYDSSGDIAPANWPDGIVTQCGTKSNTIDVSSQIGSGLTFADLYDGLLADNGLFSLVEQDGYLVNGALAAISMKGKLRGLRSSEGVPIFTTDMKQANRYLLDGAPMDFPNNGAFDPTKSLLVAGDWSQAVYGVRQDITWKIATEASIHDSSGTLVYNLFQDDMVALRMTMRMGWALPNPINAINSTTQFPFAALVP
ncbi:MAG: phage major capsid protein [Methanothrix sp.]|nr:phage major capsid protein [Methanothrix sp.]